MLAKSSFKAPTRAIILSLYGIEISKGTAEAILKQLHIPINLNVFMAQ
jgi:hypothetical protein